MKNLMLTIISLLLAGSLSAQVNFNNNTVSAENYSSALGVENTSTGLSSFASGKLNTADGMYSVAIGYGNYSSGASSFLGGVYNEASGTGSMGLGLYLRATQFKSFIIGTGYDYENPMFNNVSNSLMIGFGSTKPTFFIGEATGSDETGKIGIGDVTDPQAKLHIKSDYGEDAAILVEPNQWNSDGWAEIQVGNNANAMRGSYTYGLQFKTEKNYLFNSPNAKVGIGTFTPTEKLEVAGKIKTTGFQLTDGQQGEGKYLRSDADGNASWEASYVNCLDCLASGQYASTLGMYDTATGVASFAGGYHSVNNGSMSFVFGKFNIVPGSNSIVLGNYLKTATSSAFIIGMGDGIDNYLVNNIPNSLMIGFNSVKPTLFVGGAIGNGYTGKIGIGDVTDPLAKLHIKGDQDEQVSLFIEPYQFGGSYDAELWMGTEDYGLRAAYGRMFFNTGGNYIFNSADANVGIGTLNPLAKLQVNGDIFINDENAGLILKSPDGQCWKITVNNSGELTTTSIDCNLTTGAIDTPQPEENVVRIYPNPAKNSITIENTYNYIVYATLRDMEGTLITTQKLQTGENTLNIGNLATGTYIVTILNSQNEVLTSEKIMKM